MDTLERLTELITPVLEELDVKLYELQWTGNGKNRTLEVAIMKDDGSMDLDTCAIVSEKLSEVLDACDFLKDAYMLEVCSPGAEREIHDLNELNTLPDPYVYMKLKNPVKKMMELTGSVTSYDGSIVQVSYRDKAATRSADIPVEDIVYIRMAVKF